MTTLDRDRLPARPGAPAVTTGWYPWYVAGLLSLAQLVSVLDRFSMSVTLESVKADLRLAIRNWAC